LFHFNHISLNYVYFRKRQHLRTHFSVSISQACIYKTSFLRTAFSWAITQRVLVHIYFAAEAGNDAKFDFNQGAITIKYKKALENLSSTYFILYYVIRFWILCICLHLCKDRVLIHQNTNVPYVGFFTRVTRVAGSDY